MTILLRRPMPYTRDALTLIRAGASAADLGWNAEFYHRICRRHELREIAAPTPPNPSAYTAQNSGDKSKSDKEALAALTGYLPFKPWGRAERRILTFDYYAGARAVRYEREVGRNIACLMIMFARAGERIIPSAELTAAIGSDGRSGKTILSIAIRALRDALIKSQLDVLGRRGEGYCLIGVGSDDPARIDIVSLGNEQFADIEKLAQR